MKSHQWSGHAAWDLFPTETPDVLWHGTSQCWLSLDVGQNPIWRMCARFLLWELQNCNSLLNNHQQENVGSHQKRCPMLKGKGEAQQDDRCGEIAFRIKPHTCQRCLEGSNKTSCAPVPETPETGSDYLWVFECFLWGTGQQWPAAEAGALAAANLGANHTAWGMSPLGGGHHSPP